MQCKKTKNKKQKSKQLILLPQVPSGGQTLQHQHLKGVSLFTFFKLNLLADKCPYPYIGK